MTLNTLIKELKDNNEDFELYPTTEEIVRCIYNRLDTNTKSILDIGCGTCNFKNYLDKFKEEETALYNARYNAWTNSREGNMPSKSNIKSYDKYFAIEKSQILLQKLDKDVIVLGTDFNNTLLIDKKADVYFCNPPYSEFESWTCKIIKEGNFKKAYLVIPRRWNENKNISQVIEQTDVKVNVLGTFDFLDAERSARAIVDVLEVDKRPYISSYGFNNRELKDFDENAFDNWFNETFKMRDSEKDNKYESELEKEEVESIKNEIVSSSNKGEMLVKLYNNEQLKLFEHFKAITNLDVDILRTIGVKKEAVKEALKQKVKSLKVRYWKIVFDEFEEITDRLVGKTREEMFSKFTELQTVDFTLENIYPLILWVIKNANNYYEKQLKDFFKKLSSPENVRQYKSNKKVFELDEWRHTCFKKPEELSHYTLDYRIIMSSPFKTDWNGNLEINYDTKERIKDICTIARNLGFEVGEITLPNSFSEECIIYYKGSKKKFMTYRVYKNGNMHVKFDIEFAKAMNVEVSRLMGWIRGKEDITAEFPEKMAEDAEKYFKVNNYLSLSGNNKLLRLTVDN